MIPTTPKIFQSAPTPRELYRSSRQRYHQRRRSPVGIKSAGLPTTSYHRWQAPGHRWQVPSIAGRLRGIVGKFRASPAGSEALLASSQHRRQAPSIKVPSRGTKAEAHNLQPSTSDPYRVTINSPMHSRTVSDILVSYNSYIRRSPVLLCNYALSHS